MEPKKYSYSALINHLIKIQIRNGLIKPEDSIYFSNLILSRIGETEHTSSTSNLQLSLGETLNLLADHATSNNKISAIEKESLINDIGNLFLPIPSEVQNKFKSIHQTNPQKALHYLYKLSVNSYYIKNDSKQKNIVWDFTSVYGPLKLSINLAKPEKSPEAIALLKSAKASGYPACPLCRENIGYSGNAKSAPRQNLRYVDLPFKNEKYFLQFSPYSYFNEHFVLNNFIHKPMEVTNESVNTLITFCKKHPRYFLGSNADLPIVGGSILNHDHFQGGRASFPIQEARSIKKYNLSNKLTVEILRWPISTIKITGKSPKEILRIFDKIKTAWYGYNDPELKIFSKNKSGQRQNAITPFVSVRGSNIHLYLMLRNNGVSSDHPLGIFHFHEEHWNIKKENIGIIEQIGLAILPGRLANEMDQLIQIHEQKSKFTPELERHREWFTKATQEFSSSKINDFKDFLYEKIGETFVSGLEDCGVFKHADKKTFIDFIEKIINK